MKIGNKSYVELHYKMSFDSFEGEVGEETKIEDPIQFVVGEGEMLEEFEKNILGLEVGSDFRFVVPFDKAFGPYDEDALMKITKKDLEQNEENKNKKFKEGDIVQLYDEEGEVVPVEVIAVDADSVSVDLNHPLVGEDLYFQGTITVVEKN